jgi:hypothetical protein
MNLIHAIETDDGEVELRVEFGATPFRRGMRDSLCGVRGAGPALEPDEPAAVEVESVTNAVTGEPVELDNAEMDRVIQACWESVADSADDYFEDR